MSVSNGYSSNSNTSSNSSSNDHQISMKIDRGHHHHHHHHSKDDSDGRGKNNNNGGGGGARYKKGLSLSIPSFSLNRRIHSAPSFLTLNAMNSRKCPIKVVNFMLVFVVFIALMISIQMVVFKHILNLRSDYLYENAMVGQNLGFGTPADVEDLKLCLPKTKIAFAKTHKTGSTTLQNIIFR